MSASGCTGLGYGEGRFIFFPLLYAWQELDATQWKAQTQQCLSVKLIAHASIETAADCIQETNSKTVNGDNSRLRIWHLSIADSICPVGGAASLRRDRGTRSETGSGGSTGLFGGPLVSHSLPLSQSCLFRSRWLWWAENTRWLPLPPIDVSG